MRWRFDDLDPQVGLFFEQELTSVREEVLRKEKKPKNGFDLLPQDDSDPDYAEEVEVRMWDSFGMAMFIADASHEFPLVDVHTTKEKYPVKEFGCAYKFTFNEIRAAQALNKELETKKALAAREAIERRFNRIMFYGAPVVGLFGLLNFPHIPRRQISIKFDKSATPREVLDEMNAFVNSVFDIVEGDDTRVPDTLGMPPSQFAFIASTPWSENAGDTTILQHFEQNNYFIDEVRPVRELKSAGPNGNDVMVAFRDDEEVVSHKLVKEFTQEDPYRQSNAMLTNCTAKSGGVISDFPLEMVIGEFPK